MKDTIKGLVSIILPVYNRQAYIQECIDSVTAQSYHNYEIIIVDDGSTDNSYDLCQALAAQNSKIKVFSADHGGVSNARNIALEHASGEYIFFLDSDDVIYPLLLETLVSAMQSSGAAIGGTNVISCPEQYWSFVQKECNKPPVTGETTFLSFENALDAMFCGSSPLGLIGGVMIRNDLIGDTTFHIDIHIGEDFLFIYENLIKGAACIFLEPKWYYTRHHDSNSSWDFSYNGFWSRFYRRVLVWKSEESFGRTKYANIQKRDAFGCFTRCIARQQPHSSDGRKMRKVLLEYRQDLLSTFSPKERLIFYLYVYCPCTTRFLLGIRSKLHKRK